MPQCGATLRCGDKPLSRQETSARNFIKPQSLNFQGLHTPLQKIPMTPF
jgi:hypothetical protein